MACDCHVRRFGGTVRFCLLGPVEVRLGGRQVDVGHARQRCVLVTLLVEANSVVSVDQLIDRVWGEGAPVGARGTLYTYLSRLRQALAGNDEVNIGRRPGGYVLTVDPLTVDVHRFHDLLARARNTDDDERVVALLEQAIALWRGEAFATLDTPWLDRVRATLDAELRGAELDRNDLQLRLGRHGELLAELATRAAEHPLDERLAGQLMLALYRGGRQADALRVYRNTRTALVDELGIEPGAELHLLHKRILTNDPELATPTPAHAERPAEPGVVPRQLPAGTAHFTGRDQHLAEVEQLREDKSSAVIITAIDGTAGVGKTALAVHFGHRVAHHYPDGQLYLDLRGYAPTPPMTAPEALGWLLRGLGLPPERIPADEQGQASTYRSLLAGKRMLVVLDNARSAEQIRPLLPGSPDSLVIVTSRTMLTTVDGAVHLHLDVLSEHEALALLARLVGPDRVAAEPEAAATLVALCARLPLAVRIAGARLAARPGWPIGTLVERLTDARHRLDELRAGDRAVRASFAVSHHALRTSADRVDQTAARAFQLLGVLDWVDLSVPVAAELLDQPQPDTRAALERLVDDHLLDSAVPGRYHTHDLLRLYARELAQDDLPEPGRQAALNAVLHCYLAAAEQATRQLAPMTAHRIPVEPTRSAHGGFTLSTLADVAAWADAERPNVVAIARQASTAPGLAPALAVRLTAAIAPSFDFFGYWHDLSILSGLAAQTANRLGDRAGEALARQDLGFVYARVGSTTDSMAITQQAMVIYRNIGDRPGEQRCLLNLGFACRQQERFTEAIGYLERGLAICREIGHPPSEAANLDSLGQVYLRLHRFDEAIAYHRQALAIEREISHQYGESVALANLGWAHQRAGHVGEANTCFQQSLVLSRDLGNRYQEAEALWGLGQAQYTLGHRDRARTYWQHSIAILRDIGELTDDEANTLLQQPIPDTPEIIQRNT